MSVRGIGGIFFKAKDPKKLQEWYVENLGLKPDEGGYIYFMWDKLTKPGLPTAARNLYKVGLPFNECFKKERNLVGLYIPKCDYHCVRLN